jgi:hypothetical protein
MIAATVDNRLEAEFQLRLFPKGTRFCAYRGEGGERDAVRQIRTAGGKKERD